MINFPDEEYPTRYEIALKVVREFLREEWDPIGVKEYPTAYDEYDSYAPGIARMILHNVPLAKIEQRFVDILDHMGLGNSAQITEVSRLVPRLISLVKRSTRDQ